MCGLIGQQARSKLLAGARLAVCCDLDRGRAQGLAAAYPGAEAASDWHATVTGPGIDIVIVATTHNMLAPIAATAAGSGKHVFIEKPGARRASELDSVADAANRTGALVRVGFNHRYHRSFQKARALYDSGAVGPLLFIRGRYGHGGRPGYENEWRRSGPLWWRRIAGSGRPLDRPGALVPG